jgi:hypothetical protein
MHGQKSTPIRHNSNCIKVTLGNFSTKYQYASVAIVIFSCLTKLEGQDRKLTKKMKQLQACHLKVVGNYVRVFAMLLNSLMSDRTLLLPVKYSTRAGHKQTTVFCHEPEFC